MTTNDHAPGCAAKLSGYQPWNQPACNCHVAKLRKLREALDRAEACLREIAGYSDYEPVTAARRIACQFAYAYFDQKGK